MNRFSLFFVIGLVAVFLFSCSKHSSGPSAGYGPNSLFPTTNGDTWNFVDSMFTDSALAWTSPDTMVATKNAIQDNTGTVYLGMNDPNGWFDGAYIAVDPSNDAVYEADSLTGFQPYTLLALVNQDGPISAPQYDYSTPSCPIEYQQIGYANQVQEYGYPCYYNVELITDCNNNILEQTDFYLSPGVGPVRIVDWLSDTTGGTNRLYEHYSQTLTAKSLH
jgi:hypothetical protein